MGLTISSDLNFDFYSTFKNFQRFFVIILFVFQLFGCSSKTNIHNEGINEVVMTPGMTITVVNSIGKLVIIAGENYLRSFSWDGDTRSVIMKPRKDRWNGSLGIYYPGNGSHWKEHDGITRAVLEEGVLNFNSIDAILEYIARYGENEKVTYNDNGLFIFWDKSPGGGGTLNVMLWQLLINGKPPNGILGSHNSRIKITR